MDKTLIAEVANQIIKEEILLNWKLWTLMLLIWLVSIATVSYFSKFFEKRGEALATKRDFDDLLKMLKTQTEATEKIKATISHEDWSLKENKVLKRQKLEEAIIVVNELYEWYSTKKMKSIYDDTFIEGCSPKFSRLEMLVLLYFPELDSTWRKFEISVRKFEIFLDQTKLGYDENKVKKLSNVDFMNKSHVTVLEKFTECEQLKRALLNEAKIVMHKLLEVKQP